MSDHGRAEGGRDRVDVLVVTHNTAPDTPAYLRTLVDQETGLDLSIVVVDSGSTDGTPDQIEVTVPEAHVVRCDNRGFSAGVNTALAHVASPSPWVLLLNPDALPRPGALAAMLRAARGHPGSVVAARLERPDGTLEHSTNRFPSLTLAALTLFGASSWLRSLADRFLLEGAWRHDEGRFVDWAVGAALLIPRSVFDRVGGLDERFFLYAEDLDWCWRAADAGHRVWFEPSALVTHVGGASASQRYDYPRRTHTHLANTYRVLEDRWPRWKVLTYRALQSLGSARVWVLAIARRDPGAERWRHHLAAHLGRATQADR